MVWSRVLSLVVLVALLIPPALLGSAPSSSVPLRSAAALAATSAPAPQQPDPATPLLKRKAKKDHRRGDARKRERQRDTGSRSDGGNREPPPRLPDRARTTRTPGPSKRERARQWENKCTGPDSVKLPQSRECTHGGDPAPPGFSITRGVPPLSNARARSASAGVVCAGDGQSGPRVQVLYGHASNVASRYDAFLASFRAWAADADAMLDASAAETGGSRHWRLATTACVVDVTEVTLSPSGDDSFDSTISELKAQGYNRTDRKYLIFVDTTSAGICGIGTLWRDDSPDQANWNNSGPSYARVDAGCWNGHTAAHEMMHNLGGVQLSAPNTSGGFHCIDEYDIMCYSDAPYYPSMRFACPQSAHEYRFDCGHNDYFDTNPANGSYLSQYWNAANNQFLIGGDDGGDDVTPPTVSWVSPVGNGETYHVSSGSVALEATAIDDGGVDRVEFWRYDESAQDWVFLATDRSAPYTASLAVADIDAGSNYVTADAYDQADNWSYEGVWIERAEPPSPDLAVRITSPGNGTKVKAKKLVTISATVSGARSGVSVEFRVCSGGNCSWLAGRGLGIDASAPYSATWRAGKSGAATFLAQETGASGADTSDPVTVSIKKAKKKKHKH
jgi:hypothetical protein